MMRDNIKKILKEYIENRSKLNDFMGAVDYAQKKAVKNSDYPRETEKVKKMMDTIKKDVSRAYKEVTGKEPVSVDNIVIKVDGNIKAGKIASFKHPESKKDIGVMKIHPDALEDPEYVEDAIKHETIHGAHGLEDTEARNHGGDFQKVADKVELPKNRRS